MHGLSVIGAVFLIIALWLWSGLWEWQVPEAFVQKILDWERKQGCPQVILRISSRVSVEEVERFARSVMQVLPKIQRELGLPVAVEIEWDDDNEKDIEDIYSYRSCLSRCFPSFGW